MFYGETIMGFVLFSEIVLVLLRGVGMVKWKFNQIYYVAAHFIAYLRVSPLYVFVKNQAIQLYKYYLWRINFNDAELYHKKYIMYKKCICLNNRMYLGGGGGE